MATAEAAAAAAQLAASGYSTNQKDSSGGRFDFDDGGTYSGGWEEGKAILFDDSFEHEVHNRCGMSRAVLQVVIRHPSLQHDREL